MKFLKILTTVLAPAADFWSLQTDMIIDDVIITSMTYFRHIHLGILLQAVGMICNYKIHSKTVVEDIKQAWNN